MIKGPWSIMFRLLSLLASQMAQYFALTLATTSVQNAEQNITDINSKLAFEIGILNSMFMLGF